MAKSDAEVLLSEIARKLNTLKCICNAVAATSGIVIENYQPLDCNGDPIGAPISVMPTISVAKQDVAVCNWQQLSDGIALAVNGAYNEPILESATTDWNLSDNNDISKVHSINIAVTGAGTVDLTIDGGTSVTLPVGYTYNQTVSSVFNKEYTLDNFTGGAVTIVTGSKSI